MKETVVIVCILIVAAIVLAILSVRLDRKIEQEKKNKVKEQRKK